MFTSSGSSTCSDSDSSATDDGRGRAPSLPAAYSFNDLCVPWYPDMLRFACRMTGGDTSRAADVVQASYLKAFRAWSRWRPAFGDHSIAAKAWLFKTVANTYMKDYRAAKRIAKHEAELEAEAMSSTYGQSTEDPRDLVDSAYGDEVTDALAQLSDEHRDIVEAFYICGFGVTEVAEVLGVPKGTVFSRLSRAHVALEGLLGDFAAKEYGLRRARPRVVESGRGEDVAKAPKSVRAHQSRVDGIVTLDHSKPLVRRQSSRG